MESTEERRRGLETNKYLKPDVEFTGWEICDPESCRGGDNGVESFTWDYKT